MEMSTHSNSTHRKKNLQVLPNNWIGTYPVIDLEATDCYESVTGVTGVTDSLISHWL